MPDSLYQSGQSSRALARMESELRELRDASQMRVLEHYNGVNLCSNDYLGLSTDPRMKAAVAEAVNNCSRVSSTGSRLLSGNAHEWECVESEFAEFAGTPSALYFSSGFAANIGLLTSVLNPGDLVFSDSLNHASIIDGIRLSGARKVIYSHCDLSALRSNLAAAKNDPAQKIIVTESVFSMDGDHAPLLEILSLAREHGAEVIVDEAHATGVIGPQGRGMAASLGIENELLAVVHMCGKALASMGAFVCSGSTLKNYLINRARSFIFSTAMPPYMAGQISAALRIARGSDREREHLAKVSAGLRTELKGAGFDVGNSASQIVPVVLGDNDIALAFASALQASGFAVRAIRPPTVPPGTARLRLSLASKISLDDVHRLVSVMKSARERIAFPTAAHTHV